MHRRYKQILCRCGSRVLEECRIRQVKNIDQKCWANLQILEAKMTILRLFPCYIVLLGFILAIMFYVHSECLRSMFQLRKKSGCWFALKKCRKIIQLEEWHSKKIYRSFFFKHCASVNQLPGFSISGTLGANELKKLVQQTSVIKIWHSSIKISPDNFFQKSIHFKPSY